MDQVDLKVKEALLVNQALKEIYFMILDYGDDCADIQPMDIIQKIAGILGYEYSPLKK